jgi:hypothetical protein
MPELAACIDINNHDIRSGGIVNIARNFCKYFPQPFSLIDYNKLLRGGCTGYQDYHESSQ